MRSRSGATHVSARAAILAVLASACAPRTPPDPPRVELLELTPAIEDHVLVLGTRGAAEPGLDVVGLSLDRTSERTLGFVAADGSFLLEVPGLEGDVLRIQLEEAGLRSTPLDVIASFGTPDAWTPALPCLRVPSAIDLATTSAIAITNDCQEPVSIALALRTPAPLTIGEPETNVPPGDTIDIALARTGPVDVVVLLHVTAPLTDRRAISVLGR